MPTLILGVLVLVLALWLLNAFSRSDPKVMARLFKAAGGIAALAFAALLFFRGALDFAIPLALFGLGLLGWIPFGGLAQAQRDRWQSGGREHADADDAARQRGASGSGKMTEQEAYQILGVEPGATKEEIGRAHRALMKKLHPDQGGSTYLAARVNEAKEILLRRHR